MAKLYTWAEDFSSLKNTPLIKTSLITKNEIDAFENIINAHNSGHNSPNEAPDCSTTGGCSRTADCGRTVCACGPDT